MVSSRTPAKRVASNADPGHEKEKESPPENASENHQWLQRPESDQRPEENARKKEGNGQKQKERFTGVLQFDVDEVDFVLHLRMGKEDGTDTKFEVNPHYRKKEVPGDNPYEYMEEISNKSSLCLVCTEKEESLTGNILKHVEFQHMGKTPGYACPICVPEIDKELPLMLRHNLKQHLKTKKHTDKTKLYCLVDGCTKKFTDNKNLVAHYLEVHKMEKITCRHCGFNYCFDEDFPKHMAECKKRPGKSMPPKVLAMKSRGSVQKNYRRNQSNKESINRGKVPMEIDNSPYGQGGGSNQTHGSVQTNDRRDESNEELIGHSGVQTDGQDSGLTEMGERYSINGQLYEVFAMYPGYSHNGQDYGLNQPIGSIFEDGPDDLFATVEPFMEGDEVFYL